MSVVYLPGLKKSVLFIVCSSLISGCSSLSFDSSSDQCDDCSSSAPVNTEASPVVANQEKSNSENQSTTLVATNEPSAKKPSSAAVLTATQNKEPVQVASREASFKGPKALQDIQAISVDVNQGRNSQETTNAANVFIKDGVNKHTPNSAVIAKVEVAEAPVKADVVSNTEIVAVAAVVEVTQSAEVKVAALDSVPEKIVSPEINSVEQVNRLIEENPTAAGTAAVVVLDVPEVKVQSASQVIKASRLIDFGIWNIEEDWDGRHPGECRLSTATMQIDQHDFTTQVWLTVIDDKLVVNSTFDINIKQPGIGIKADNGSLQRFSEKVYSSNAVWSGNLSKTLKNNNKLKIILGGGELGKKTHETSVSLKGLKKGYPEYQKCKG